MSEKQKLISVIIPVYNTAPYLPRCLDSVINNDYKNLEIICVNDGSTDSSPEILRGYEKNDSRIKVFDVKNGGVSRARNTGLDNALGEYIAFVDSDDWIHRQYFDILIDFAQEQNADIVSADYIETGGAVDDNNIEKAYVQYLGFDGCGALKYKQNRFYVWGKLFSKKAIDSIRFDKDMSFGEDNLFVLDVYGKNKKLGTVMLKCALYRYFVREQSASREDFLEKQIVLYKRQMQRIKEYNDKDLAKEYLSVGLNSAIKYRRQFRKISKKHPMISELNVLIEKYLAYDKKHHILPRKQSRINSVFAKHPGLFDFYWKAGKSFGRK